MSGKLERRQLKALLVNLQGPTAAIPVAQHDTPCRLAIDHQLVNRWPMGMAMHQGAHAMRRHYLGDFLWRDVDDFGGLRPHLRAAFAAQLACQLVAGRQRQLAQDPQAQRIAQQAAHLHVAQVAGAQGVAMHQQHLLTTQLDHAGVAQQGATSGIAEGLANQEVTVAMHQVDGRATVAQPAHGLADRLLEGRHGIVANPRFEEVTKDVQGLGVAGAAIEQIKKRPGNIRAFFLQVQIRDQQNHSMISAFSMITSSFGTSWWPALEPVATFSMASTTSRPSITSPNTA